MNRCLGTKRDNSPCTVTVDPPQTYCWWHDPKNAEERRRAASRGGRGKANRELRDIKALCEDLTERLLSGDLVPGPAAVANQLMNTRLRVIEQERRLKESEDLEARIEALERAQGRGKGARRSWRGA